MDRGSGGIARFSSAAEGGISNAHENCEWISMEALLVAVQAHRARCADSQNGSMAGFSLPEASRLHGASLMATGTARESQGRPVEHEIKVGAILINDGAVSPK